MIRFRAALLLLLAGFVPLQVRAQLPETIERIKPSIAAVGTYQKTRSPPFAFRGTGFVIADGTLVATNAHVLPEQLSVKDREALVVLISSAGKLQPREARPVAVDTGHDLAVLKMDGPALPALELNDAANVREGQSFAFTGFPIGNVLGLVPVTHRAIVSAVTPIAMPTPTARQLDANVIKRVKAGVFPVFQLDATAYPGNSGSPMYDVETGRVVAIVNMVFIKTTRENVLSQPSGIAFAIPIRHLRELLAKEP
jgi:S1-C subfamily serine protease